MTATVTEQAQQPASAEPQAAPKPNPPTVHVSDGRIDRAPRAPEHNPSVLESLLEQPIKYRMALEPTTFDEGWRVSQIVAKLHLCQVTAPEDAYARILTGRAIGLPAMASIQGIALIYQKKTDSFVPCMYAKLKLALALSRHDIIEYIRPKTISDTKAIWVGKRHGQPEQEYEFTWEDAKRAELVGRGGGAEGGNNYDRHPKAMLSWRACGRLCDIIAADVLNGIATREEVQDEADRPEEPSDTIPAPPAQAAPPRDFGAEAEVIKQGLTEAFERKDDGAKKSMREAFKKFEAEAPEAICQDIREHYTKEVAKAKAAAKAPPASSAPQVAAVESTGGQQSLVTT